MMKKSTLYIAFLFLTYSMFAQPLVQGTILKTGTNTVTVYGKPNVSLNNVLFEGINICLSIPNHGANNPTVVISLNHMPTLAWIPIGTGPEVLNGRAYYTWIGNDNDIVAPLTWLAGSSNPIIEFTFSDGDGQEIVRLDDLSPDGGTLQQSFWYVQANVLGDITNYSAMFYGTGAVNNSQNSPSYVPTSETVSLPIKLSSFTARPLNGTDAQLNWTTATELNSSHFEVQRSTIDQSWSAIGTLAAAVNSQTNQYYSLVDSKAFDPTKLIYTTYYYRLKMVNFDGSFEYSELRLVNFEGEGRLYVGDPFPNPARLSSNSVQLPVSVLTETEARIDIYDIQGSLVASKISSISKGDSNIDLGVSKLSTGVYHIKLTLENGGIFVREMLLQ